MNSGTFTDSKLFFSVCGCGVMKLKVCWVFAKCKLQSCIISRKWTIERWDVLFSRKGVRGTFNHCLVKVTPYRFLYICLARRKKRALKELSSPFCQISRQWFLSHEQNPWLRIGSSRIWGSCYFINNGNLQFLNSNSTVSSVPDLQPYFPRVNL